MVLLEVPEGTVEIEAKAYKGRTDITVVRIPASVKSIGQGAFDGCSGITTLHLAEGLESIGSFAFRRCPGIVGLGLPESVRSIGDYSFLSCTGITDLDLPEGLQTIGQGAFNACAGLETLVLPASLTSIYGYPGSFAGCKRLARALVPDALAKGNFDLWIAARAMADPAGVFEGCPALATGLTPFSAVKPPRRRFWHPTMHAWCTAAARACVVAVLVAELRVDRQEDPRLPSLPQGKGPGGQDEGPLVSLPHELWLLILEFVPRRELGAPLLPAVPPPHTRTPPLSSPFIFLGRRESETS